MNIKKNLLCVIVLYEGVEKQLETALLLSNALFILSGLVFGIFRVPWCRQ